VSRDGLARRFGEAAVDELERILGLCEEAAEIVTRGRAAFDADRILRRAAEAIIMHLGESVARPRLEAFREAHPFLGDPRGWQIVKDTANFYDHQYAAVDPEQTWRILERDIPTVADFVRSVLTP